MAQQRVISMLYTLKDLQTGEILESNKDGEAITFITGFSQVLQPLEDAVLGMAEGEEKEIKVGEISQYDNAAVQSLPKEQFAGIELKEGMELFGEDEQGNVARVIVKAIGEDEVMVDFNHPFAGKDLVFDVKVIENREANADEIASQRVESAHTCECGGHENENDSCCGHHDGGCCGRHH